LYFLQNGDKIRKYIQMLSILARVVNPSFKPPDGQSGMLLRTPGNGHPRGGKRREIPDTVDPAQSAALREQLIIEVGNITSADSAALWAREALAAKNCLAAADAKLVEDAFEGKLSGLAPSKPAEAADDAAPTTQVDIVDEQQTGAKGNSNLDQPNGVDKSVLVIAAPRRYRNREHLRYIAQQACLICGRKQSDPHHLRYLKPRALGRKVSDEFAVPLCRSHHRAVHRASDEQAWWKAAGIDPVKVARQLWRQTRSASDGTRKDLSSQLILGQADDGQAP
jgi:hypothetical protein